MCDFLTSFISHLEKIDLLSNPPLPNVEYFFILQYQKISFVNITTSLIRNIFKYLLVTCQTHSGRFKFSQNSHFHLKVWILSPVINTASCFSSETRSLCSFPRKYPRSEDALFVLYSSKNVVAWKAWLAQLTSYKNYTSDFPQENHRTLFTEVFMCISYFLFRTVKRCVCT